MPKIKGTVKKAPGVYLDLISGCKISKGPGGWVVCEAGAHPTHPSLGTGSTLGKAVKLARGDE